MRILVHYRFTEEQVDRIREIAGALGGHEVVHTESEEEAVRMAPEAEVIIGHFLPSVCAAAPKLRWVQSFSAGMDKFLFPEMVERDDVVVTNAAGLYAPQGGEHAWAMLLALARGIIPSLQNRERRQWKGWGVAVEVTGGTLGIIGMGAVGRALTKKHSGMISGSEQICRTR